MNTNFWKIETLETEKSRLEAELNSGETDYHKLEKTAMRIGEIIKLSDEKMFRWIQLDEQA